MSSRAAGGGFGVRWTVAALSLLCILAASERARGNDKSDTSADRLLGYAADAAVEGDVARQFALLREAVRQTPDDRRARWQLGQVQVDGEWLAVEEAQRRAAADPMQEDYRRLRDEHGDTAEGQLALARWCRSNRLEDESRVHWSNVLSVDPNHREALRVLKLHWSDGKLLGRDDIKQAKKAAVGERSTNRRWTVAVAQWERALAKKRGDERAAILAEIRAVRDINAIPAFERLTLDGDAPRNQRERTRADLSRAFVDALGAMPDQKATESLTRHGVLAESATVREAAAELLHDRPLHDFVPLLLEGLAAPIESTYRREVDPDGSVHYLHEMYREGPFADWSHRVSRSIHQPMSRSGMLAATTNGEIEMTAGNGAAVTATPVTLRPVASASNSNRVSVAAAGRSAARYEEEIETAEQEIAAANAASEALNDRIFAVLRTATDESLADEPREWWDWWQDHTEYYRTPDRPVLASVDVTNDYITLPAQQCECFAAGTAVWTKTGQRAIETLKLGDLVLSQNVDTGELTYRPVIGRTVRPPSEIMDVSLGREMIRSTRGHLFWVPGAGWRMAKELQEGTAVHGLPGTTRIRTVESAGQAEAYNLVVADFNTYFVGDGGWLVHDNTPRKPTRSTLPGIAAK
jgi:hypothetical protein